MEIALKPCNKCGVAQPLDSFYQDRARSDGRRRTCIACDKARKRTPEVHEQSHRYYHSEKGKAAERKYYHEGKGQETRKAYNDRPEIKERRKPINRKSSLKWYYSDKGQEQYASLKADPSYREWRREYQKEWYRRPENLERVRLFMRAHNERRLAMKKGLPATLTAENWQHALAYFEHRCAYCGDGGKLTQDHFIPLSAGGHYSADNIVPCCKSCNPSKKDKPPEEWCSPEEFERVIDYFASLGGTDPPS